MSMRSKRMLMRSVPKITGMVVLLMLLVGCGVKTTGFQKVPDLKLGEAGLYLYRADRNEKRAPTFAVFVDEAKVGSLPNDGYLSLVVPSGARTVHAGLGDGGLFSKESVIKTTLVVDDQRHYYLQVVPVSSSGKTVSTVPKAYFTLIPEATATEDLQTLRPAR